MTVPSDATPRDDYTGNGVTTVFVVSFQFLEKSHLVVTRTVIASGVETTLVLDSVGADGFTAIGEGDPNGGSITVVTAPTTLQKITITTNVPTTQLTDYIRNDPFPAESHERALDKLTMIARQLKESINRTLRLPLSSTGDGQLPPIQPLKPLLGNAAGDGLEFGDTTLTGDMLLRGDLASSANGKGMALVNGSQAGLFFAATYGSNPNSGLDEAVRLQTAIDAANAAGGGVVVLAAGTYLCSGIVLKSGVTLRGAGMSSTEIIQSGSPVHVVQAQGSLAASVALTANALAGDTTLQLTSTATLAADDFLILSDTFAYNPLDGTYVSGEMVQVLSVDSGVQVTLYAAVKGSLFTAGTYTTANAASVRKITMIASPAIEELTITGNQATTTVLASLKYTNAPRVHNVRLRDGGHYGLRVDTCRDADVVGVVVADLLDDIGNGHVGYGILAAGANDGLSIRGYFASRCRHAFTTIGGPDGFSRRVTVIDSFAVGTTQAGFDTHASGDGILFANLQVHGSLQQGIQVRSINTEVVNCLVSRCNNHGIAAGETLVKNMKVSHCTVEYAGQHGFSASSAVDGLIINDSTFRSLAQDGIRVTSLSNAVQIINNYVNSPGTVGANRSGITSVADGANPGRWFVQGNHVRADTGSVAFAVQLPNVNTSYAIDNKAWGTYTTQAFSLGLNLDLRNDVMDAMAVTPTQIVADQNNYAPSGHGSTGNLRISSDAARSITGLQGGVDAREIVLTNIGAFTITLPHDSASSTAANRFFCPGSASLLLRANGWVRLSYDGTSSRWRVMGA